MLGADWNKTPTAKCAVIEDHTWLARKYKAQINVLQLNALISSFKILRLYAEPGDEVMLVNDNTAVVSWLKKVRDNVIINFRTL
jgi:hypothetical protein